MSVEWFNHKQWTKGRATLTEFACRFPSPQFWILSNTGHAGSLAFEVKKSKEYSMFNSIDVLISLSTDIDEN